ncbi:MAG: hypothetical protein HQ523_05875 [Lentisphaerae bacterium]|nr:hypothetical protein [Lentisphaerota bacterium]
MKLENHTDPIGDKVDEKSDLSRRSFDPAVSEAKADELMIEFDRHYAELVEAHPEHEGKRDLAFQGWIIQKVAGLQLCVSELERRIAETK